MKSNFPRKHKQQGFCVLAVFIVSMFAGAGAASANHSTAPASPTIKQIIDAHANKRAARLVLGGKVYRARPALPTDDISARDLLVVGNDVYILTERIDDTPKPGVARPQKKQ